MSGSPRLPILNKGPIRNRSNQTLAVEAQSWLIFFSLTTLFLLLIALLQAWPAKLLTELAQRNEQKNNSSKEIKVLLENPDNTPKKEETEEMVYMSDQNSQAQGQLTKRKKFEALTKKNKLEFAKRGSKKTKSTTKKPTKKPENLITAKDSNFIVKLTKEVPQSIKGNQGNAPISTSKRTSIPSHYKFRDQFALSWDRQGRPQIPTKKFEHYQYFRDMLNKIQNHWAPPGGQPYPVFGDEYHSAQGYAPGRTTFQSFPEQDIRVAFMLNEEGDVIDTEIWQSMGYKSLDVSCLEAIKRSENFGEPPEELLKKGSMVVPMIFRIAVRGQ